MKCECGAFINPAWTACLACGVALEKPKAYRTVRMAPDVALQMAVDAEALFIHLWRRLAKRLSRVMAPGYLTHARAHEPELWARREAARLAWDDPEVWSAFKACGIPWTEYRRRIYQWTSAEFACIRLHREHLGRGQRHAA